MGIVREINKNMFNARLEGKLMSTIKMPIFIKDFNKDNQTINTLNQLLENFTDPQRKRELIMNLIIKREFKEASVKYILNLKIPQSISMGCIILDYNMIIISQT